MPASALLAFAAGRLGDAERAGALHSLLLPFADRVAVGYPEIAVGAVAHFLGVLSTTMAHWDEAERHFEDALKINEGLGARPWLAHTYDEYARMALVRSWPGDADRASRLIGQALAAYRDLGMDTAAARLGPG